MQARMIGRENGWELLCQGRAHELPPKNGQGARRRQTQACSLHRWEEREGLATSGTMAGEESGGTALPGEAIGPGSECAAEKT